MDKIYIFTPTLLSVEEYSSRLRQELKENIYYLNRSSFTIYFINVKRFKEFVKKHHEKEESKVLLEHGHDGNSILSQLGKIQSEYALGKIFFFVRHVPKAVAFASGRMLLANAASILTSNRIIILLGNGGVVVRVELRHFVRRR
jgi:hypothetical protein